MDTLANVLGLAIALLVSAACLWAAYELWRDNVKPRLEEWATLLGVKPVLFWFQIACIPLALIAAYWLMFRGETVLAKWLGLLLFFFTLAWAGWFAKMVRGCV